MKKSTEKVNTYVLIQLFGLIIFLVTYIYKIENSLDFSLYNYILLILSLILIFYGGAKYRVTKRCPDCIELIKVKAKVCRYCGKKFD